MAAPFRPADDCSVTRSLPPRIAAALCPPPAPTRDDAFRAMLAALRTVVDPFEGLDDETVGDGLCQPDIVVARRAIELAERAR